MVQTTPAPRVAAFGVAVLALVVALMSPLDDLADHVLFVAHMFQHLILLLLVPPLLLIGLPEDGLAAIGRGLKGRLPGVAWAAQPLPALLLSVGVVWVWHVPIFYETALRNEAIHVGEHLCFLATALLYWWSFARPATFPWAFPELLRLGSLLAALIASSILGAALTFAAPLLYPTYASAPPLFAALGVTPLVDQQLGGLLMWVGGGLWYLAAAGVVLARWFTAPIEDEEEEHTILTLKGQVTGDERDGLLTLKGQGRDERAKAPGRYGHVSPQPNEGGAAPSPQPSPRGRGRNASRQPQMPESSTASAMLPLPLGEGWGEGATAPTPLTRPASVPWRAALEASPLDDQPDGAAR